MLHIANKEDDAYLRRANIDKETISQEPCRTLRIT